MGFDYATAKPIPGKSDRYFTAVPSETEDQRGKRTIHLCMSIKGVLLNWNDEDMKGAFLNDDGTEMTARDVKIELLNELEKGHKVLPTTGCDNFD